VHPDLTVLQEIISSDNTADSPSVLKEEVEEAVRNMKTEKSPGIDNIPAELMKGSGEKVLKALTISEQKKWPTV